MKVSLSWLKEYVNFNLSPDKLADELALSGTAVEGVEHVGIDLDKVVVGQIRKIVPHPKADKLVLCLVDVGKKNNLSIVCGAKNMKVGDKVVVASVGAKLSSGMVIKKTNIRGQVSNGMLCAEDELDLSEDHSGIIILDKKARVGQPVSKALGLEDTILELEITPNRGDCLGMIGVAREVAAILKPQSTGLGRQAKPSFRIPQPRIKEEAKRASEAVKVEIKDAGLCPRYVARLVEGVKVGPSPLWLKQRLEKAGIRPINNVVDITNYVMLETSQPLHAFDFDKIKGRKIIVRRAKKGEDLLTLDGVDRQLDASMLVIADAKEPVALAGVMGGASSEISKNTTTVLLESASFKPQSILRTSRTLGLLSESSARFEKGVDPNGALYAANRAVELIQKLASGKVCRGAVDVYPKEIKPLVLKLRLERLNAVLGTSLSTSQIVDILESLELRVSKIGEGRPPATARHERAGRAKGERLQVTVPTFRPDLTREIDLVEEVGRLFGLNTITSTLPASRLKKGGLSYQQQVAKLIKETLLSAGLIETITYSFINPKHFEYLRLASNDRLRKVVEIKNPLVEEQSAMRTTLIPGLLETLRLNASRGELDLRIFEVGRVFCPRKGNLPLEPVMVTAAFAGNRQSKEWWSKEEEVDFFDAKGVVEILLDRLGVKDYRLEQASCPWAHPARCAEVIEGNSVLGVIGELHPKVREIYELPKPVTIFELKEDELIKLANFSREFSDVPRYPAVPLDVAVVVDEKVADLQIMEVIRKAAGNLLVEVRLFDVYRGKQIPKNKKSLAYSLVYQSKDRTLELEEVQEIQTGVITALKKQLQAQIRQ